MSDASLSARIMPWDDRIWVAYDYPAGNHSAHPITAEDWPVIRRLEAEGRLAYANEAARELIDKLRALGLDHGMILVSDQIPRLTMFTRNRQAGRCGAALYGGHGMCLDSAGNIRSNVDSSSPTVRSYGDG